MIRLSESRKAIQIPWNKKVLKLQLPLGLNSPDPARINPSHRWSLGIHIFSCFRALQFAPPPLGGLKFDFVRWSLEGKKKKKKKKNRLHFLVNPAAHRAGRWLGEGAWLGGGGGKPHDYFRILIERSSIAQPWGFRELTFQNSSCKSNS